MSLKELRISKRITQLEASIIVSMPLRTYQNYENDSSKKNTIKYKYLLDALEKYNKIDEDKGILSFTDIKSIVSQVLTEYDKEVECCYLFGSYAKNNAKGNSDVDLLVLTSLKGLKLYGLVERLRQSLHKRVDLLDVKQLNNNLALVEEILKTGIKIYG